MTTVFREASDLGYRTGVIADACSAADEPAHDAALASLGLLAEIVTSVAVIEALTRGAAASR
jgi:nicotinamidase-related amidase